MIHRPGGVRDAAGSVGVSYDLPGILALLF